MAVQPLSGPRTSTVHSPAQAPKFGNAMVGAKLVAANKATNVFKNIVEVFLWAFLAQDLLAMCLVRMIVSLKRGRLPYDPNQDPEAKNRPMSDQIRLWAQKNVQGLNWPNFAEESARELATGPGVLAIPALAFAVARRTFGKSAVELGYNPLTQMGHGFMDQLAKLPEDHILNESLTTSQLEARIKESGQSAEKFLAARQQQLQKAYQGEFQKFLGGLFADKSMLYSDEAAKTARALDGPTQKMIATMREEFAEEFGKSAGKAPKNFVELIDQFAERYTQTVFAQGDAHVAKNQQKMLEAIGKEVEETIIKGYNQAERLVGQPDNFYKATETLITRPVIAKGKITGTETAAKEIPQLMHELHRFKDVALKIGEEKMAGSGGRGYLEKTAEVGTKVINKLVGKKMALSAGSIGITGIYLIYLAKWVQHNKTYPGERQAPGAAPAPALPAAQPAASAPMQLQPVGAPRFAAFLQQRGTQA